MNSSSSLAVQPAAYLSLLLFIYIMQLWLCHRLDCLCLWCHPLIGTCRTAAVSPLQLLLAHFSRNWEPALLSSASSTRAFRDQRDTAERPCHTVWISGAVGYAYSRKNTLAPMAPVARWIRWAGRSSGLSLACLRYSSCACRDLLSVAPHFRMSRCLSCPLLATSLSMPDAA